MLKEATLLEESTVVFVPSAAKLTADVENAEIDPVIAFSWKNMKKILLDLGPNHLLLWWQISVKTLTEFLHLAGALMEYFLGGSAPLRLW